MNEAELKLTLFRRIDQLSGEHLRGLFRLVEKYFGQSAPEPLTYGRDLEAGYATMAADTERETEALEWIEGVLVNSVQGK